MTAPFFKSLLTPEHVSRSDGGWYREEDSVTVLSRVICHPRSCRTERERQKSTKTSGKIWFQYKLFAFWPSSKEKNEKRWC
jgi:hypothetical protein